MTTDQIIYSIMVLVFIITLYFVCRENNKIPTKNCHSCKWSYLDYDGNAVCDDDICDDCKNYNKWEEIPEN